MKPQKFVVLCAGALLGLLVYSARAFVSESFERGPESPSGFAREIVVVTRPEVLGAVRWAAWLATVSAVAVGVVLFRGKRRGQAAVLVTSAVSLHAVAALFSALSNLDPWIVYDRVIAKDGSTYAFLESSFLQGQRIALGGYESTDTWGALYRPLGFTNGDSPRSWLAIVRPAGSPDHYGQLHSSSGGVLVGVRNGNRAFFAYDTVAHRFYGHGAIEKLSPFVLVSPDTVPDSGDMDDLLKRWPCKSLGCPDEREITIAVKAHPNARIRELAAQMLARPPPSASSDDPASPVGPD